VKERDAEDWARFWIPGTGRCGTPSSRRPGRGPAI